MRISKCLTSLAIVLLLSAVSSNSVFAAPGAPGVPASPSNNGATVNHLSTSYFNAVGGVWTLNETKVINKNHSFENFSGTISDLSSLPAGTYTTVAGWFTINGASYYWNSDFGSGAATSLTLTVTDNGDGTGTVEGHATY